MEFLDVLDKEGNYTGQIEERGKIHKLNIPHWEVVILLVNNKGQTLLQKRSKDKVFYPNYWGVCSGHVDAGEELIHAALRELEEELGIKCNPEDLHILEEKELNIIDINSNVRRFYYTYCDKKEDEFIIQESELTEVKWYDIDELINIIKNHESGYTMNDNTIYLLERLKNCIKNKYI